MSIRAAFFSAFLCALCVLIVSCEPAPTPLPVVIPPTNTPPSTGAPPIRIAVDALYAAYVDSYGGFPLDHKIDLIDDSASWSLLPEDLGSQYDAAFTLTFTPEWNPSEVEIAWEMRFNPNLPPLDQPEVIELIRQGLSGNIERSTARTDLANAGFPDGLTLSLIQFAPSTSAIDIAFTTMAQIGIDIHMRRVESDEIDPAFAESRAHLALVARRVDENADFVLMSLPLRFRAASGIDVTFTAEGLPIVRRNG